MIPAARLRIPVSLFIHMCHGTSIFVLLLNVENVFFKNNKVKPDFYCLLSLIQFLSSANNIDVFYYFLFFRKKAIDFFFRNNRSVVTANRKWQEQNNVYAKEENFIACDIYFHEV